MLREETGATRKEEFLELQLCWLSFWLLELSSLCSYCKETAILMDSNMGTNDGY